MLKMEKDYWNTYWDSRQDSGHRCRTEEFYRKMAMEKRFLLGDAPSLLDFGCGAADLLVYLAPGYKKIIGADFSSGMLEKGASRLKEFKVDNVVLMNADDKTLWSKLGGPFDRISATGVLQYMTLGQIDDFIGGASRAINADGKIGLFEIIDPRKFSLWKFGFFDEKKLNGWVMATYIVKSLRLGLQRCIRRMKRLPPDQIGYSYHPDIFRQAALRYCLELEYLPSQHYEYRYHIIMSRKKG